MTSIRQNTKESRQDAKQAQADEPQAEVVIRVRDLKKVYRLGSEALFALNGVSFEVRRGEFCAILGTSGSGKSTLLNMLAGLEPPSKGDVEINGVSIVGLNEEQLVRFRREHVGFVFQSFNLISSLSAWENVALPLLFRGVAKTERKKRAIAMLDRMGLKSHVLHKPNQMSGGQQQRVGIARALLVNPAIIFADEPTGNLDSNTGREIMETIQALCRDNGQTLLMVTHDEKLARYADRIFHIRDGKITHIETVTRDDQEVEQTQPDVEQEVSDGGEGNKENE